MKRFLLVFLLLFPVSGAYGGEGVFEKEAAHLLEYIERSGCTFIRNGNAYSSAEARAHIEKKYRYIKKSISSAEQFITFGASKSSITGKKYSVECAGVTMPSELWLKEELALYRETYGDGLQPSPPLQAPDSRDWE